MIHRIRAVPLAMEPLDVNDAIREVIALTRGELSRSRVALETRLAEAPPFVLGDRVQLQQVILNLILNAIDAIGDGERRELVIETREDHGPNILVSVSDTGPSLDSQTLPRVFDAFYTTKPGGLGMGLPICLRSLVPTGDGFGLPQGSRAELFFSSRSLHSSTKSFPPNRPGLRRRTAPKGPWVYSSAYGGPCSRRLVVRPDGRLVRAT